MSDIISVLVNPEETDTINITVNPDGDEVTIAVDDSAGAAVFAAAAEASAIAAADAAATSTEKAAIAQAQAELVIGRGLYLPEDNLSITYNADGTINTVSNGTLTKRITYSNGVAVGVATI